MKAIKMFKMLGYTQTVIDDKEIIYRKYNNIIRFGLVLKTVSNYYEDDYSYMPLIVNEVKSINQQCKELGWLE